MTLHTTRKVGFMEDRSTRKRVVFVVDDEPLVLRAVHRALRPLGLETRLFERPSLAIASCAELSPELVMADYRMPEMNGLELLAAIRALVPGVVAILYTGTPPPAVKDAVVLRKPATAEELCAAVTKLLPQVEPSRPDR